MLKALAEQGIIMLYYQALLSFFALTQGKPAQYLSQIQKAANFSSLSTARHQLVFELICHHFWSTLKLSIHPVCQHMLKITRLCKALPQKQDVCSRMGVGYIHSILLLTMTYYNYEETNVLGGSAFVFTPACHWGAIMVTYKRPMCFCQGNAVFTEIKQYTDIITENQE